MQAPAVLKAKIFKQPELFPENIEPELKTLALGYYEKYCIKYNLNNESPATIPPPQEKAEFHNIDIKSLDIGRIIE